LFESIFNSLSHSLESFSVIDVLDIGVVVIAIYFLLKLTSRTRAMQVLKGFGMIIILAQFTQFLGMSTISWLLNYIINAGAIVLIVLFQPELRRALERIGTGRILDRNFSDNIEISQRIDKIIASCITFSKERTGALIVVENKTGLNDIIETGTSLHADVSSELLENIFFINAPLHDGAVIIRENKILAAGCFLPLSDNRLIGQELGTRHRAGLGISEISDSITIMISEETGIISIAKHGKLIRYIDKKALRDNLESVFNFAKVNENKVNIMRKFRGKDKS